MSIQKHDEAVDIDTKASVVTIDLNRVTVQDIELLNYFLAWTVSVPQPEVSKRSAASKKAVRDKAYWLSVLDEERQERFEQICKPQKDENGKTKKGTGYLAAVAWAKKERVKAA